MQLEKVMFTKVNIESVRDLTLSNQVVEAMVKREGTLIAEPCPYCSAQLKDTLSRTFITEDGVVRHVHCDACGFRNIEPSPEYL